LILIERPKRYRLLL